MVTIKKRYKKKISHFRRNDRRIQKKLSKKYGKRSKNRTKQIIHNVSKEIVKSAKEQKEAIVVENIKGIKDITHKGDQKGKDYRFKIHNAFPYGMLMNQIKYKGEWEGVEEIELSRKETRNTSRECSVCINEQKRTRKDPEVWKLWPDNRSRHKCSNKHSETESGKADTIHP